MPSEKCRIAAAGQHSAPNSSLVKTARPFWTAHTGIALDLVATQIFARRFAAIQPVVCKRNSFRTDECVELWIVGESIFLRWIGELNCGDISDNAQKLQPPVNSTSFISAIQSKSAHWDAKIDLPFQMPQGQDAFLLLQNISCHFLIYWFIRSSGANFHSERYSPAVVSVATMRIFCVGLIAFRLTKSSNA